MIQLTDLQIFLDRYFAVERYGDDQGGVYHQSDRAIRRIGLALEPWPRLAAWVERERLHALFLHRPWKLRPDDLRPDVGVIAYHLAFDERLTLGYNPRLADALHLIQPEILGEKNDRPIGMIGAAPEQTFTSLCRTCGSIFGGVDETSSSRSDQIRRVAVVGAMTDALVREAAERGADVYLTGQCRQPARVAVAETGIGVIEIGHRRSEAWGLRALAGVLRERWAELSVVLPPM